MVVMDEDVSGISITFKYGKGYEEPWMVFKGTPGKVRRNLIEAFGLTEETMAGLTLSELLIQCNHIVHGTGNAATILGGVPIAQPDQEAAQQPTTGDPWAGTKSTTITQQGATSAPEEKPHAGLISQIAKATTAAELQRLWAANKDAFNDSNVVAHYKAKGQSL